MPYNFNPHRHVKIWLSKDKNTFLNLENQIRLVKMRDINPNDEINFIYDAKLLSPKALADLNSFCARYNIIAKNIHQDVFPLCQTEKERQLIEIYNDEMSHLEEGGNVAVGSDILRWLKPVYELGTYTDFDVHVDTSKLPEIISVEKPVLINIGSCEVTLHNEAILLNNDRVAVVHSQDALPSIEKIQQAIYNNCSRQPISENNFIHQYLLTSEENLGKILTPQLAAYQLVFDPNTKILKKLAELSRGKTGREVRKEILDSTANNLIFSKHTLKNQKKLFSGLTEKEIIKDAAEILENSNLLATLFSENNITLSPQEKVTQERAQYRMTMLKHSVIQTSGPRALHAIFGLYYNIKTVDTEVAPFAFSHYGLADAFKSDNSFGIHSTRHDVMTKLQEVEVGKCNDLSWLQEGQNATAKREQKMIQVQSLFRDIPQKINAHIQKIENQLNGCLGFYRNRERHAKIDALRKTLNHFGEGGFDIQSFNAAIENYQSKDISASIGKSKTKELIDELKHFVQLALDNNLTTKKGVVIILAPASDKQDKRAKNGPAV